MIVKLKHPDHGYMYAYNQLEVAEAKRVGWLESSEEEHKKEIVDKLKKQRAESAKAEKALLDSLEDKTEEVKPEKVDEQKPAATKKA